MVFSSLSGVTPQCGAQGLRAVSEGTNCQGYDSVNDWCGARLFLSACQVAGMFNVLIIGCSVVYISLSAPLSHLNCQSTSKACRSFVFFPTSWMFSPQLSAGDLLWPESQLTDKSPIKKKHPPISLLSCRESIAAPVMGETTATGGRHLTVVSSH